MIGIPTPSFSSGSNLTVESGRGFPPPKRHASLAHAHRISLTVFAADRRRLTALVKDRNTPQKHVWRAEIVLLSADGLGTVAIMRRTGKSKTCVWRWQERFAEEGCEGLLRDKTRPPRIAPLGADVAERVVALIPSESSRTSERAARPA